MDTNMSTRGTASVRTHPTSNNKIKTLSTMPNEVVIEVFESLDSLRSAINLASTCRTFSLLYKRFQPAICLSILPSDAVFQPGEHAEYPMDEKKQLYPKAVALFVAPVMKLFHLESVLLDGQKLLLDFEQLPQSLQIEEELDSLREKVETAREKIEQEKAKQRGSWTDSADVRAAGHDETRLLRAAGMKAVKDMTHNAAVVRKMAEIYMQWMEGEKDLVHHTSDQELEGLKWHGMDIASEAFYDLWIFSARGEYLVEMDQDDFPSHPDNLQLDYYICNVLNRLDWSGAGFPDPLSVLEGEAPAGQWGEHEQGLHAVTLLLLEAEDREQEWKLYSGPRK